MLTSHANVMKINTDKFEFKCFACYEALFRCLYIASQGFYVYKQGTQDSICA